MKTFINQKPTPRLFIRFLAIFLIIVLTAISGCSKEPEQNQTHSPWRGAYMNTFATNGEIINTLKHTNIYELLDLEIDDWQAFPFAPPINELAVSGDIDIVPEGVIPVASLLARDPENWRIVARLIHFPIVLVARNGSGIESISDLKGKTIGTPFGSGAHPPVFEALAEAGLSVEDVNIINLGIPEQVEALNSGLVDVVGTWEPQVAVMKERGLGLPIASYQHTAFFLLRKEKMEESRSSTVKLLKGFILANMFVSQNPDLVRAWYSEDSRFEESLLSNMMVTEPNVSAQSIENIEINVTQKDLELGTEYSSFMYDLGLLPVKVNFEEFADLSYLEEAKKELLAENLFSKITPKR